MLLRMSWIIRERWLCDCELESAGGAARSHAESSSAFSILTSDRYVSIPSVSGTSTSDRLSERTLDQTLISLAKVCRIRSLWLAFSPEFYGDTEHWTPEILIKILQSCPELQSLSLSGSLADDSVLLSLPDSCPNLKVLRIGRTCVHGSRHQGAPAAQRISPHGLSGISALRKLEVLDCRGIPLSDESIVAIAECQSLRSINISGCRLKIEDVGELLTSRTDRLIVVSEYVEYRSSYLSIDSAMAGTDPELSDQVELLKGAFPSATFVTTGDWYKWKNMFGEYPDCNAWYQMDWSLVN